MSKSILFQVAKWLFGLHFIVFGLNKFLGFADVPPPEGEQAIAFLTAMFTTYLFKLVATTQIIGGILLLIPRTSFLGYLMLLPVVANIVAFHFAHAMPGNGLWIITLVLTFLVGYSFRAQLFGLVDQSESSQVSIA